MVESVERSKDDGAAAPVDFRIVGVGASAGGLESLEQFFGAMPADSGMAFVVVQHLSPDFKTLMPELLGRYSDMEIGLAGDGEVLFPNHIYLLPPGKEIEISEGRLFLTAKESRTLSQPIDVFLRSLAKDAGERAVAIVLSGSGSDGSHGIVEIKRAGGSVLAESPETARFDGMPSSAAATGLVDFQGAPEELAAYLTGAPLVSQSAEPDDAGESADPLGSVLGLLDSEFGIDFSRYKTTTVGRRLERRVGLKGLPTMQAYLDELRSDPAERSSLYQDLLIGVTRFFRDPEAFAFLEREVIPRILEKVKESETVRVWVAGCATGEEAYSLAILFHDALERAGRPLNLKVLATDMHRVSLDTAATGHYTREQLAHVDSVRLERHFVPTHSGYQVSPELRQHVVFVAHNVMKDAPFTRMHLISCRNLLIYLHPDAQKSVLSLFHFGLASTGILFLGSSETPGALSSEFAPLSDRWKVFRKRRDVRLIEELKLPLGRSARGGRRASPEVVRGPRVEPQLLASYDRLLDRFMPPSFLIDEGGRLLDSFAGAERLLSVKPRRPTGSLLDMLEGDLKNAVAGALVRVVRERAAVSCPGVRVEGDTEPEVFNVSLEPVGPAPGEMSHLLVTFAPVRRDAPRPELGAPSEVSVAQASNERMQSLEGELSYAREILQSMVEELETSNEELQATNEELVASNEELQSTNEELHSVNEELHTVNAEYQAKIDELQQLNADIEHLLEGTEVGTVFLDRDLRIRRYTARIARVFRLQERDLGREIRDFSHSLRRPTLIAEIEKALGGGGATEDEVRDEQGTPYFLRVLPYRTGARPRSDGAADEARPISGVVLTITDISALDKARQRLAQLSAIVESSEDAILRKDLDGTIQTWNRAAERLYGYTPEEAIGKNVRFLCLPGREQEVDELLSAIRRGERFEHFETTRRRKDGRAVEVSITLSPITDELGKVAGASAIARDITQLRAAQRESALRQERIEQLLDSTAEAIFGLDPDGLCTFANPACARLLGYGSPAELIGKAMHSTSHHSRTDGTPLARSECRIEAVLLGGRAAHSSAEVFWRADGSSFPVEYWSHPMRRDGEIVGAVVAFLDITERRKAEDEAREASARRERFLALLSHELRNPLAAVLNAIRVVGSRTGTGDIQHKARQVVERQGRHMARLLDDLLDVSRITNGKFDLHKERMRLDEAVHAALESLEPLLLERRIAVDLALPIQPIWLDGDAARLQQVVANLVSNAARYSPPGARVELEAWQDGDQALLSVRDRGHGIEPGLLPRIFDLFVQSDDPMREGKGGLGVGLSLVRSIVELHRGSVVASSAGRGQGSEFLVTVPASSGGERATTLPPPSQPGTYRIVLVEDQADAREMLRALLEMKGHSVSERGDGRSALDAIGRERPDVAIVDIGLPEMSGYDVAREVRRDSELDGVFMIALTGYGSQTDVRAAMDAGFDAHLTKPTEPERLFRLLDARAPSSSARRVSGAWLDRVQRDN